MKYTKTKNMKWITESNRLLHLFYGCIIALFTTIIGTAIAAFTAETKDKLSGGKFDWLDIAATMIGGLIATALQVFIYFVALHDGIESALLGYFGNIIGIYVIVAFVSGDWKWVISIMNKAR